MPIPSVQKLLAHEASEQHKINLAKQGKNSGADLMPANSTLSVSFEDELYARTIRTVHTIVVRQLSLNDMYHLLELQNANGAVISFDHSYTHGGLEGGGIAAFLEAGVRVLQADMRARVQNPINNSLFPRGVPFGFMGDGSNDRSLAEQEAVVVRFLGPNGRCFNTFFDLAELDMKESVDGHSPDAKCIEACYAGSLDKLNVHNGFLFGSDWRQAAVGMSFDGASVMLGSQNGVAAKLKAQIKGYTASLHAVAHVEQLAMCDAFKEVEYFEEWKSILQEVYGKLFLVNAYVTPTPPFFTLFYTTTSTKPTSSVKTHANARR